MTPGFGSWSGCTRGDPKDGEICMGCSLWYQRDRERFPIFSALLNAVHKGVKVRILTMDYGTPDCPKKISCLPFLALNGVEIVYFTSLTFMHVKYIEVDGVKASVSSVNFSYTSFMLNREAGLLFTGASAKPVIAFYQSAFQRDFSAGLPVNVTYYQGLYDAYDLKEITNPATIPIVIPSPDAKVDNATTYNPVLKTISAPSYLELDASPDFARHLLLEKYVAKNTFEIMIYQINEPYLCQALLDMQARGVTVTVLISSRIYSRPACIQANQCYAKLQAAGIAVRMTPLYYTFSHQKFWIYDGTMVGLSTGNWAPTDFPQTSGTGVQGSNTIFPPFGQPGWRDTNRDFLVYFNSKPVCVFCMKIILFNLLKLYLFSFCAHSSCFCVCDTQLIQVFQRLMTEDSMRGEAFGGAVNNTVICVENHHGKSTLDPLLW